MPKQFALSLPDVAQREKILSLVRILGERVTEAGAFSTSTLTHIPALLLYLDD
jgi:hypothetical protein